jgi:hypothetical protein
MTLENVIVYRMTHIENIPHILHYGITHKNSPNCNPNFVPIGDQSLIDARSEKRVFIDNGKIEYSIGLNAIVLGDFIPFYFGVRMPMLYVVQNGGNFVENATSPQDIVYMACSLQKVIDSSISYYFTDGHATDSMTSVYDDTNVENLEKIIDWDAIKAKYWSGNENLNVKRKKQAEFLVGGDLPADCIVGYVCYDDNSKQKLIDMGIDEAKIKVFPNAYY